MVQSNGIRGNAIRDSVLQAIGNTPVVRLRKVVTPSMADVLVKLEYYNPTGSYKDRMALAMIEGAEARGELRPGMRVVEWTGGSTGSSLAMVCAIKGYRFTPISSDGFAKEKLQTMRLFGADLEIFPAEGGKLVPELYQRMKKRAEELAQQPGTFYTDQFHNTDAIRAYMGIGTELVEQAGTGLAAFCGGVGTAGMISGVSRALKEAGRLAGAHHGERRAAPRRGDRRRIPAATPEGRRIRRSAHGGGTGRSRDGATPGEGGRNLCGHVFGPQCHGCAATGTGTGAGQHCRHSGRR